MADHLFVAGSYWPSVLPRPPPNPPHTTIFDPVHTALCAPFGVGAPDVVTDVHVFVAGS
jgi:hypothetical protein